MKGFIYYLVFLLVFSSCSQDVIAPSADERGESKLFTTEREDILRSFSTDIDWIQLKKNVFEMSQILRAHNYLFKEASYLDEDKFYPSLEQDANRYKKLFEDSKGISSLLQERYFSDVECLDCISIYQGVSVDVLNKKLYSSGFDTDSSWHEEIDCWNWRFFACGEVASSITVPPLFALALVLCVDQYC